MGHSKEEKAESHERIIATAAARFREIGIEGIGVADLMKDAGLTHGGFYRHFDSRDALVSEAVERALYEGSKGVFDAVAISKLTKEALLDALIDWYLGLNHRDNLATSCGVTSLAADVARSNARAREAYSRQVGLYLDLFADLISAPSAEERRIKAIAAWSTMVGALTIARAVNDEKLSLEILKTAAASLKAQLR